MVCSIYMIHICQELNAFNENNLLHTAHLQYGPLFFPLQQCFPVMKAADFKMLQDLLLTGIEIQKVRGGEKKKRISFALLEMCS